MNEILEKLLHNYHANIEALLIQQLEANGYRYDTKEELIDAIYGHLEGETKIQFCESKTTTVYKLDGKPILEATFETDKENNEIKIKYEVKNGK